MKIVRNLVVGTVAAIVLAGSAGLALALAPATHTLSVRMPDGGTAEIQYAGDVAPKVSFKDDPAAIALSADAPFPDDPVFAELRRMSVAMDRQMNDLMSRMTAPGGTLKAGGFDQAIGKLPEGGDYTMISTRSNGGTFCSRSVEVTRGPNDKAPRVTTRTSGNCKAFDTAAPATHTDAERSL